MHLRISSSSTMVHATSSRLSFEQQLEAILNAYNQLLDGPLQGAQAVFKRYFLSDAANQADDVIVADVTDCAKSIIQQAPLRRFSNVTSSATLPIRPTM